MAKFIIDTDDMAVELNLLEIDFRAQYLIEAIRLAHKGGGIPSWLTPYQEKKKQRENNSLNLAINYFFSALGLKTVLL